MSLPISTCLIAKAAAGDADAYDRFRQVMAINLKAGHWSTFPCPHEPPCPRPTEEQLAALAEKLDRDLPQDLAQSAGGVQ